MRRDAALARDVGEPGRGSLAGDGHNLSIMAA